jgi:hypothetical protein
MYLNSRRRAAMNETPETFEQFWSHFLRSHTNRANRLAHTAGVSVAMAVFGYALLRRRWWLLAAAPLFATPFAIAGHALFEGNRPENAGSAGGVLRGALANLRMWKRTLDGSLDAEVERLLSEPPSA